MKKVGFAGMLFAVLAVIMLFAVGAAGAAPRQDNLDKDKPPPKTEGGAWLNKVYPDPAGAAVRIDFEVSGQRARRGLYVIRLNTGGDVASWYARGGEIDSGWISNLDLPRDTVWVEVVYYSGPGAKPVTMTILNNAPKRRYGWLAKGTVHALEVAWPGEPLMGMGGMPQLNK